MIDEITIEGELTNERIDLAERQRRRQTPFEVAPQEAIGRHTEIERGLRGILKDRRPVLLRQREYAEDATDARFPFVTVNVIADGAGGADQCGGWQGQIGYFG